MKILYGVQGTGNGHITRARNMVASLAKHTDIEVDYLFSGRPISEYFDMQAFQKYQCRRGFTFVTKNGQIKPLKTLVTAKVGTFLKDVSSLNLNKYDLLLNDFEPITAWAAKKAGVPSLSLSHQAAFLHHVPKQEQSFFDKIVTKYFAPTQYSLGTHWHHFGYNIIPPVVTLSLVELAKKHKHNIGTNSPILVYLPFENLLDIRIQLQVLRDYTFICYHPKIQTSRFDKNIIWQPPSTVNFKRDLIKCAGVISNSGFELSTECLSIGKPLLVKPLQKQYEQLSNAYTLQILGLCSVMNQLSAEEIDDWLQVKQGIKIDFPTNCNDLVTWIKKGKWDDSQELCKSLWQQVTFPPQIEAKLAHVM